MAYQKLPSAFSKPETLPVTEFGLDNAILNIAHWLPTQGPIKDFIHHNTLHAVQSFPFHEGVALSAKLFEAKSYLPIADYQQRYRQGRIKDSAIDWALLKAGCPPDQQNGLKQTLFAEDKHCHYPPLSLAQHGIRNAWLNQIELELNAQVHPIIFRLLGNFLDQGISRWSLPKKGESFWESVVRLTHNSLLPLYPFSESHVRDLLLKTSEKTILFCLEKIVGNSEFYEQYLLEMLLAHPGWAGMVRMIEENPRCLLDYRKISLKELIAVELVCELALLYRKKGLKFKTVADTELPKETILISKGMIKPVIPLSLKIWHEAMEWSLYGELLSALQSKQKVSASDRPKPEVQVFFCIDDRECSIRRHLEGLDPGIETFGAAGFFGIDFLYQGLEDAYPVAQCPAIIQPKHLVIETELEIKSRDSKKNIGLHQIHFHPHSFFRGWLYTQTLGVGYAIKMAWEVFRPGSKLPAIPKLSEVGAHTNSHLHLHRKNDTPNEDGYLLGFSYAEMADKVAGLLINIGLTQNIAPLVVVVAHGSSSVNNPHFAAYDCGACSGKPGAPNARAFAWMGNHPEVRKLLNERGIIIPAQTQFIGALHNTSRDEMTYFDEHFLTQESVNSLSAFKATMANALALNAQERCRWFEFAPKTKSLALTHAHAKTRASSIFEVRPELNHDNNLYAVVGRRQLTRDLFLDRRAFLHSYDPCTDDTGVILGRILSAVIPVCGGINLEYLFSRIDNSVYGAGTKLPHNVIGLLGVANGVEGDLRTGLPSQMIEVHEPARLLIVVEQATAIINKTVAGLGNLREWLDNEWVRLVSCHPETGELFLYVNGCWETISFPEEDDVASAVESEDDVIRHTGTIPVFNLQKRAS